MFRIRMFRTSFAALLVLSCTMLAPHASVFAQGIDLSTQQAIQNAILEYDALESQAFAASDASLIAPRATGDWLAKRTLQIDAIRDGGFRQESRFVDANFIAFRPEGSGVAVDSIERWNTRVMVASTGLVVLETGDFAVSQTVHMVLDGGTWKIADAILYQPGESPF